MKMPPPQYTCSCGKQAYEKRRDAKRAARHLYPGQRMKVYRHDSKWHIAHARPEERLTRRG